MERVSAHSLSIVFEFEFRESLSARPFLSLSFESCMTLVHDSLSRVLFGAVFSEPCLEISFQSLETRGPCCLSLSRSLSHSKESTRVARVRCVCVTRRAMCVCHLVHASDVLSFMCFLSPDPLSFSFPLAPQFSLGFKSFRIIQKFCIMSRFVVHTEFWIKSRIVVHTDKFCISATVTECARAARQVTHTHRAPSDTHTSRGE